ncbi:MAG: hypothetical protein PUC82_01370 [bacterium]|nr:hypothetical protein [bacterium]
MSDNVNYDRIQCEFLEEKYEEIHGKGSFTQTRNEYLFIHNDTNAGYYSDILPELWSSVAKDGVYYRFDSNSGSNICYDGKQTDQAIDVIRATKFQLDDYIKEASKIDDSLNDVPQPYDKVIDKVNPRFSSMEPAISSNLSSSYDNCLSSIRTISSDIKDYANGGMNGTFGDTLTAFKNNGCAASQKREVPNIGGFKWGKPASSDLYPDTMSLDDELLTDASLDDDEQLTSPDETTIQDADDVPEKDAEPETENDENPATTPKTGNDDLETPNTDPTTPAPTKPQRPTTSGGGGGGGGGEDPSTSESTPSTGSTNEETLDVPTPNLPAEQDTDSSEVVSEPIAGGVKYNNSMLGGSINSSFISSTSNDDSTNTSSNSLPLIDSNPNFNADTKTKFLVPSLNSKSDSDTDTKTPGNILGASAVLAAASLAVGGKVYYDKKAEITVENNANDNDDADNNVSATDDIEEKKNSDSSDNSKDEVTLESKNVRFKELLLNDEGDDE